jgi:putative addiction module component (TIGR02574 family)
MSRVQIDHILELPASERIAIVQDIWESLREHPELVEVTAAQREELERRWVDLQQNPDDEETWEDVEESLRSE